MVVLHVVGGILRGNQRRHAFQHEVDVVGTEIAVEQDLARVEGGDACQCLRQRRRDVGATGDLKAGDPTDAGIDRQHRTGPVEFGAVLFDVGARTEHALFLAAEEHEADRPPRHVAGLADGTRGGNDERGVAAVIERSRAEIPGIKVRAEDDEFVGQLATADLTDHIRDLDRATDHVRHGEPHAQRLPGRVGRTRQTQRILTGHDRHRQAGEFPGDRVGVPVEQPALAGRCPEDGPRAGGHCPLDDFTGAVVLVEEIRPRLGHRAVDQHDRTAQPGAGRGIVSRRAVADVDEFRLDATGGRRRRPALGNERDGKRRAGEHLEPGRALGPGDVLSVRLGTDRDARGLERCNTPVHGPRHGRRPGNPAADLVRQAAKVIGQRRRRERTADDRGRRPVRIGNGGRGRGHTDNPQATGTNQRGTHRDHLQAVRSRPPRTAPESWAL